MSTIVALEVIINAGTLGASILLWRELALQQRPRHPSTSAKIPPAVRPVPSRSG